MYRYARRLASFLTMKANAPDKPKRATQVARLPVMRVLKRLTIFERGFTMPQGIKGVPVRFFAWDADQALVLEVDEGEFLEAEGVIEYERHTVHANGVDQICLTKNPFAGC